MINHLTFSLLVTARYRCKTFSKLFALIGRILSSLETAINIAGLNFACLATIIPNIQHFNLLSCRQDFNFYESSERPVDMTCHVGFIECVPPQRVITNKDNRSNILIETVDDDSIFSL